MDDNFAYRSDKLIGFRFDRPSSVDGKCELMNIICRGPVMERILYVKQNKSSLLRSALLFLTMICAGVGAAQPFLYSAQFRKGSPIRSKNLEIVAAIKKGENKGSLILDIALKNISRKEISFRDTYVLNDYSFVVKDREGNVLPPSEVGRREILKSGMISHRYFVDLPPGQQVTRQLVVTDVYSLKPGEVYTITIQRRISLDKGKTFEEVRSNTVKAKLEG